MQALPDVPAGENPYTYRNFLHVQFYPTPSAGFKVRVFLLMAITGLFALLAIIYLMYLILFESRTIKAGSTKAQPLRLFTTVDRPTGTYLVVNQKVTTAVFAIINGGTLMYFFWTTYNVNINSAPLSSASWQGFIFLPLFIHAWLAAWASLQAFILSTDSGHVKQRFWLSARSANWLFLAGGVVLAAAGLVVSLLGLLATNRLWSKYTAVDSGIASLESSWTGGGLDIAGLLKLQPAFESLETTASHATRYGMAECVTYAVLCFCIIVVLVCGVGMAQVLQKNINYHSAGLAKSYEVASVGAVPSLGGFGTTKHTMTRSDVRHLATAQDGPGKDRARLVLQLSKAKLDLLSVSVTLIVAATLAEGLLIFTAWKTEGMHNTWPLYELSTLGIGWIYPPLMVATLASLFANVFTTLARQRSHSSAPDATSLPTAGAVTTAGPSPPAASEKPLFGSRPASTVIPVLTRTNSDGQQVFGEQETDEFTPTNAAPFGARPVSPSGQPRRGIQIGAGKSRSAPFPAGGQTGRTGRASPSRGPVGMDTFIEMSDGRSQAESTEDPRAELLTRHERV